MDIQIVRVERVCGLNTRTGCAIMGYNAANEFVIGLSADPVAAAALRGCPDGAVAWWMERGWTSNDKSELQAAADETPELQEEEHAQS